MGKTPYLFRRKNVFYFRVRIPSQYQNAFDAREIVQSLRTENRDEAIRQALRIAANFKALLHDLTTGKTDKVERADLLTNHNENSKQQTHEPNQTCAIPSPTQIPTAQAPKLSIVVDDFLKRYDPTAKAMLSKLNATLPIPIEIIGDKPVKQILQADLNHFFDDVQKLPVKRDAPKFKNLAIHQIIETNTGPTISEKTFRSTYQKLYAPISIQRTIICPFNIPM